MTVNFEVGLVGERIALGILWKDIRPYIEMALREAQGELTSADVLVAVLNNKMQLWVIMLEHKTVGAAVTEIVDYPGLSSLRVITIGGKDLALWREQLFDRMVEYAKLEGATRIEAYGRPGLIKQLKAQGFRPVYVAFMHDIYPVNPPVKQRSLAFKAIEEEIIHV